jgi:hypothetical protein
MVVRDPTKMYAWPHPPPRAAAARGSTKAEKRMLSLLPSAPAPVGTTMDAFSCTLRIKYKQKITFISKTNAAPRSEWISPRKISHYAHKVDGKKQE